MEEWKPIKGYEGYYEISSFGRVKSLSRTIYTVWRNGEEGSYFQEGRILTPKDCSRNKKGYQTYKQVCLSVNGKAKYFMIHRLVAEAFIPKIPGKDLVNHIDGNKHNNVVENLEWVTSSENVRHSINCLPNKTIKPIRCVETGEVFKTMSQAERATGIHHSGISMAASGKKRKTAGGYHWEYV